MITSDDYLCADAVGFIFIGPSGSGKSTLRDSLLRTAIGENRFMQFRPHTSRKKRPNETDEYIFVKGSDLDEIESSSRILFRNEYHGNKFLTTWPKALSCNEHYLYIYSPSGAQAIKKLFPNHKIIQILPDDENGLRETLLLRDPNIATEELKRRLEIIPIEVEEGKKVADEIFVNKLGIEESTRKLLELINRYL